MRRRLGLSWCFNSLEAQACRPYNLGYFGEGATKKNQVLPPDTGKGVLKESTPAKTFFFRAVVLIFWRLRACRPCKTWQFFHSLGIFWEGAIKK